MAKRSIRSQLIRYAVPQIRRRLLRRDSPTIEVEADVAVVEVAVRHGRCAENIGRRIVTLSLHLKKSPRASGSAGPRSRLTGTRARCPLRRTSPKSFG